ncbi:hypothetical protein C1I92_18770 [Jiangella anatolica]|uniref:Enoyl reductase (ER) domain-containing protein n=2 Tax=Jiangella anatolica TaxID=2670374 RepID=A0A2W2B3P7_9ACTN|nr:hypothetical protein C1I92_18770 [Jiangella anatolica]
MVFRLDCQRMRRWTITGERRLELHEAATPRPAAGEVLVGIELTAVSAGSELHAYRSGPTGFMDDPGYLAAGRVLETGAGVTTLRRGDRVFAAAPHGDAAIVPAHRVVPVPDEAPFDDAVLCYLASLGLYCLHAGEYAAGENVAVVGLGVVGLCAALVATACGARVHAVDADDDRLRFAAGLGLSTWDGRDPELSAGVLRASPEGIDLVVETSGSWRGLDTAARMCRRGSRISVLGVYRDLPDAQTGAALHRQLLSYPAKFHYDGIRIVGCANHPWRDAHDTGDGWSVQRALRYLLERVARRRLALAPVVTDRIAPGDLPELYARLDDGDRSVVGVLIDWTAG